MPSAAIKLKYGKISTSYILTPERVMRCQWSVNPVLDEITVQVWLLQTPKADIKKWYITENGSHIFFLANLFLKQGISSDYVMVYFNLHGLTWPVMSANRELQNVKFLPTVRFEPGTFRLRCERAKRWAIWADKYRSPQVTAFYMSFLCKLPVPGGRCNNDLSCIFLI